MSDKDQITLLRKELRAERAQSSWLDALANWNRDYCNRSEISDQETCDQEEQEVDELYEEYKRLRKEAREFEESLNQ